MSTPRAIAQEYGLKLGSEIEPPRERKGGRFGYDWSREKKDLFRQMQSAAVYACGNLKGAQPRYWGDNRGGWPVLLGIQRSYENKVGGDVRAKEPYQERGLLFRVWTLDYAFAKRLIGSVRELIKERIEDGDIDDALGDWISMDPDTEMTHFELEIHTMAQRLRPPIRTWSDRDFSDYLDREIRGDVKRHLERARR